MVAVLDRTTPRRFWASLGRAVAAAGLAAHLAAAPGPAQADAAGVVLETCGAFLGDPGLAAPWPPAKAVRPGLTVQAGDLGLGCRFRLAGASGTEPVLATVALARPLADGGTAVDRWFVPVRRGELAAAVYAFAPGLARPAGNWTLTLSAPGTEAAEVRFQLLAPAVGAASPPGASSVLGPVTPPAPVPAPAPSAEAATAPLPAAPAAPLPSALAPSAAVAPSAVAPAPVPVAGKDRPAAAPAPTGYVALQTGLFADADNAAAQAARLRARGLPVCVAVAGDAAKRRYRVLAGRYGDRKAAAAARGEVAALLGVTPLLYAVEASEAGRLRCR